MFPKKSKQQTMLQDARDDAISVLNDYPPFSDEYKQALKNVQKLSALVEKDPRPDALNPNTILQVGGTLAAVILIIGYEQKHVLTSKALAFLPKLL